jgi:hypothetical protein
MVMDVGTLGPEDCEPFVGETFNAHVADDVVPLTLESVERFPPIEVPPALQGIVRAQPFSLLFTGPGDRPLPQDNYPLSHPTFGEIELFLVPIQSAGRKRYQSVIA